MDYMVTLRSRLRNGAVAMNELSLYLSIEHNMTKDSSVAHIMECVRNGFLMYDSHGRITVAPLDAESEEDPYWHSFDTPLRSSCWACGKEYSKIVRPSALTVLYDCPACDVKWQISIKQK